MGFILLVVLEPVFLYFSFQSYNDETNLTSLYSFIKECIKRLKNPSNLRMTYFEALDIYF